MQSLQKNLLLIRALITADPIRIPKSAAPLFFVIPIGQKPIPQSYGNQRPHDQDIGNAFGMKHILLQRVNGTFHYGNLIDSMMLVFNFIDIIDLTLSSTS